MLRLPLPIPNLCCKTLVETALPEIKTTHCVKSKTCFSGTDTVEGKKHILFNTGYVVKDHSDNKRKPTTASLWATDFD